MKYILSILLLFFSISGFCQYPQQRSSPYVTAQDWYVQFLGSAKMPVHQDTTWVGGLDSTGNFMLSLADTSVYVRIPNVPSGKKWVKLLKLGDSGIGGVISFNGRTGAVTLLSADVTTALGYTPVDVTTTININGTTQDLSTNRTWTVGDVFQSGSYANPSWITSLAWSKITGAPSYGFGTVTSFSGGNLSPLFTTAVANATTTPHLSFVLANSAGYSWFGNPNAGVGAPQYNVAGALTKTDDTNVTLTLGGTPTYALLKAVSMQLGWTGTLSIARGGLGWGTAPATQQFLMGDGAGGYKFVTFVAGSNMTITYGASTVTFASSGGGGGGSSSGYFPVVNF